MGEYKEKVENQFWKMLSSSEIDIGDKKNFKEKLEPVFKIKSKEAIKLIDAQLWAKLYSLAKKNRNPLDLKTKVEKFAKIDSGKAKERIWDIILFSVNDTCDESSFRKMYEPVFKIDSKRAIQIFADPLWAIFYSMSQKSRDPEELAKQFKSLVQIDIKHAAEAIKEIDPEKHQFLQYYKK